MGGPARELGNDLRQGDAPAAWRPVPARLDGV